MKEDLLKIINHYGIDNQLKYIHSEYFELDESIVQREYPAIARDKKPEFLKEIEQNNVAGEIADVMVMLKQFQYYYDISDEQIEDIMKFKISRQLERIESEGKEV